MEAVQSLEYVLGSLLSVCPHGAKVDPSLSHSDHFIGEWKVEMG